MQDPKTEPEVCEQSESGRKRISLICDRCGCRMFEDRCKIICLNCGNRFDCSDLNLFFD